MDLIKFEKVKNIEIVVILERFWFWYDMNQKYEGKVFSFMYILLQKSYRRSYTIYYFGVT